MVKFIENSCVYIEYDDDLIEQLCLFTAFKIIDTLVKIKCDLESSEERKE